jgi:acetoin utilization deacetylase AcuC-like enzyme
MLIVSSERFADHITPPGHPESPERNAVLETAAATVKRIAAEAANLPAAAATPIGTVVEMAEPVAATREQLLRVHPAAHLDAIEATRGKASMIDADTYTSPDTADVALLAAGAAVQAVDAVIDGRHRTAAALVRPPGHHAESARAMGFCFYSNVAVAAAHARARGLSRVAIVDYDVHHGNGTQEIFYDDPTVLYVSTHQYPFYPGTGAASETGAGAGQGFTVNVPLEAGATDGDYFEAFDQVVIPVLREFKPELLIISAGFDAHASDPLAQMRMTATGLALATWQLRSVAADVCGGRVVLVTEGGYALKALGNALTGALMALWYADDGPVAFGSDDEGPPRDATGRGQRAVAAVRAAQAGRWGAL